VLEAYSLPGKTGFKSAFKRRARSKKGPGTVNKGGRGRRLSSSKVVLRYQACTVFSGQDTLPCILNLKCS